MQQKPQKKKPGGAPRNGRNRLGQFAKGHTLRYEREYRPNAGSFKPGHLPPPSRRRGPGDTYWSKKANEMYVCVAEPNPWFPKRKHHFKPRRVANWEAVHGPAPPGCAVLRLLPEHTNDDPSNLVLVRRATLALLNRGHWCKQRTKWKDLPHDRDLRLAAVGMAVVKTGKPFVLLPGGEPGTEPEARKKELP